MPDMLRPGSILALPGLLRQKLRNLHPDRPRSKHLHGPDILTASVHRNSKHSKPNRKRRNSSGGDIPVHRDGNPNNNDNKDASLPHPLPKRRILPNNGPRNITQTPSRKTLEHQLLIFIIYCIITLSYIIINGGIEFIGQIVSTAH